MRMAHDIQAAVSRVSRVSEPLPGSFSSHGPWLPWLQLGRDSEPLLGFLESEEAELRSGGRLCTLRHLCQVLRLPSGCQAHSCHTVATPLPRFLTGMLPGPPGSSGKPNWSCPQTSEADRDSRTSESGETSVLWPSAMYSEVHAVSPRRAVTQRFYLLSISWDALLQGTRKCHAF